VVSYFALTEKRTEVPHCMSGPSSLPPSLPPSFPPSLLPSLPVFCPPFLLQASKEAELEADGLPRLVSITWKLAAYDIGETVGRAGGKVGWGGGREGGREGGRMGGRKEVCKRGNADGHFMPRTLQVLSDNSVTREERQVRAEGA